MSSVAFDETRIESGSGSGSGSVSYILVTGGTLSGIGKGIVASSTGLIMRSLGFNVTAIKIDPYLNMDAGTMSPFEHGEVFVLNDGGEVDLDLGNYERFMGISLSRDNNITTGKIYHQVIERERRGDYLGKTVQVIPHITDAIQEWIERVANVSTSTHTSSKPEVCVIELGGTVGDIESGPFIEALRQLQFRVGVENFLNIHVALVPVMGSAADGEQKTKPIQQSVRTLRSCGLYPDIIVCRSSQQLQADPKRKISQFCQVQEENVLSCPDVSNLYHVPLTLLSQRLDYLLLHRLSKLPKCAPDWTQWTTLTGRVDQLKLTKENMVVCVRIVIVGKYTGLRDSFGSKNLDCYLSIMKAVEHASVAENIPVHIEWIESTELEANKHPEDVFDKAMNTLLSANAILVPGGFGDRGIPGMIEAICVARTQQIPFLGICLGMQVAVIEYARNVLGLDDADSEEFDPNCTTKAIVFMPEISKDTMGGTMRLGRRRTHFVEKYISKSRLQQLYKERAQSSKEYGVVINQDKTGTVHSVDERHRHRYEVNLALVSRLEDAGLAFVGTDSTGERMEMIELLDNHHPYFVGVQYHPEYQSRPQWASPPFVGLLRAAQSMKLHQ